MYLGRYLRWDSWNIVNRPDKLIYDIADRLLNPFDHGRTWYFTLAFAAFLIIGYLTIYNFGGLRARRASNDTP
ncbi:MAG TPA: DUF1361 domain-containing protein [Bacteroidia bacterium]|nr:DUF1361 domain-containing protein [Bacteroidia bacterium]